MAKTLRKPAPVRERSKKSAEKPAAARPKLRKAPLKAVEKTRRPGLSFSSLSNERKLDLLGIVLAVIGLLTVLSLVSRERSPLTGAWVSFLLRLTGWGTFILPLALITGGLWLVLRNIERLPGVTPERVVGFLLIYLNLLSWIHFIFGGGWASAAAGKGGGYVGALFERSLVTALGEVGAVVFLLAWLVMGLMLGFDLSLHEFWSKVKSAAASRQTADFSTGDTGFTPIQSIQPGETSRGLPAAFRPLTNLAALKPQPARSASASSTTQPAAAPDSALVEPAPVSPPAVTKTAPAAPSATALTEPDWQLPAIETILDPPIPAAVQAGSDADRAHLIEDTLKSFGAPAHVVEIHRGPTVTQFGVEPDFVENRSSRMRVRVSKIVALADDLALALAAQRIRIQAPVPGRGYVGIEVPNAEISRVTLREVLESESYQRLKTPLGFALGKNVSGNSISVDIPHLPHLLIAGTTGSGKSVCVNAILCCLLLKNTPADLRLILVDPKRVELTGYNGIPHLLAPVVVDAERVVGALQWVMREMDARYHKFSELAVRNIQEFNTRFPEMHLPYLVVVIDELADLMMLAPEETERSITRLAQLARATGIHLILATQRPSVDVVTGLIKANFPARIAFAVASQIDSRVILDQPGAERLLGRGDMLFQAPDAAAPVRLQGVYVADHEIEKLVDYWSEAGREASRLHPDGGVPTAVDTLPRGVPLKQISMFDKPAEENDPLLAEAIDLVRKEGRASITMLQRRMRIGYTRAARMIDAMEQQKIIGPNQPNSQVREVIDYGPTAPPVDDGA